MSFQKILCPVDFSEASTEAARYAAALAHVYSAELTLLHVAPPMNFEFAMAQPRAHHLAEFTEHRNQTVQHALERFPGGELKCAVRRIVAEGGAADEIIRTAKEQGHDLIVMPTHGTGAIRRWLLLGSVTTKVLHAAECPVIAAVDFSGRYDPIEPRKILCAVDLGPQSARILCMGAALARQFGAELNIVHASPSLGHAAEDFSGEDWRARLDRHLADRILALQADTGAKGGITVTSGDPHRVVRDEELRTGAELVIIGRDSEGILGRLRAHAYEIIRNSACPVLSV